MNTIENFDHILLFKTNCDGDKQNLHTLLDNNADVAQWSVDIEDEDCVLRVISYTLSHCQIIEMINNRGYMCCELT